MTDQRRIALSYPQERLLSKALDTWSALPFGVSCTNQTLKALKRRGFIETRYIASRHLPLVLIGIADRAGWRWRKSLPRPLNPMA